MSIYVPLFKDKYKFSSMTFAQMLLFITLKNTISKCNTEL